MEPKNSIQSPVPTHNGRRIETPMAYFPEIESPDPTPADEPPAPTPYSLPPWTPGLAYPSLDSSSHNIPSPAGSPPSSLFRHTMPPPSTARKPLAEVPTGSHLKQHFNNVDLAETVQRLKDDLSNCKIALNMQLKENESLKLDLENGKTVEQQLRQHCATVESKFHEMQGEVQSSKILAKQEMSQKLQSVKAEYEKRIKGLEETSRRDQLELDRRQAIIKEGDLNKKKMENAYTNLEEYIAQIEAEKKAIEDRLEEMKQIAVSSDDAATEQDQEIVAIQENHEREMKKALADASERESCLVAEKEALERKVQSLDKVVDALQHEAATASADAESLRATLEDKNKALKDSYAKFAQLRSERDTLEKDYSRVRRSAMKPSPTADAKAEMERLRDALSHSDAKCEKLRAELAVSKREGRETIIRPTISSDHDETEAPSRMGRIWEAAERGQLLLEHRKDIARLKAEHEVEIKRVTEAHDQDIKEVFEEAKAQVSSRARESRKRLKREYEAKIAAMERSHQAEIAKIERESDANAAAIEVAMKESAEQVAKISKQLDQELAAKEASEASLREVERKLVIEREKSKLSSKWKTSKKQWQKDTNKILRVMQKECNEVFAHNLQAVANSPRCADDSSFASSLASTVKNTPHHQWVKPTTSYTSPLDLSLALDDTEAYVRSIVGGEDE